MPYEDLYLEVADGERIHAWYFPVDSNANTVLFCHGNAGNISRRLSSIERLRSFGVNVLIFDYRGYGKSDGSPTEANCYADARRAWRWLTEERGVPPEKIIIFGRSLGGAVAVELASQVPCGGLVVESSFTSAVAVGKKMFPFLPIGALLHDRFDSIAKIGRVKCPVLVTHSREDRLIPFEMGRRLYEAAPSPKGFIAFTGDHNDREYLYDPVYERTMRRFLHQPETVAEAEDSGELSSRQTD